MPALLELKLKFWAGGGSTVDALSLSLERAEVAIWRGKDEEVSREEEEGKSLSSQNVSDKVTSSEEKDAALGMNSSSLGSDTSAFNSKVSAGFDKGGRERISSSPAL